MKILLMVPLTSFVKEPPVFPDLGIGYIATALRKHNHQVLVLDWNMDPSPAAFKGWLLNNRPEIIGLKVFTKDVGAARKTISIIKETLTEVIIVIGGPHPSAVDPHELMEDFPEISYAIQGEAENSLPCLVAEIEKGMAPGNTKASGGAMSKIPGLVYRENNKINFNLISFVNELDNIDFPCWDLINPSNYFSHLFASNEKKGNIAPIVTTRGCPGNCTFCSVHNISGKMIRYRSPENFFEEIKLLHNKFNVKVLSIQDNCFTSNLNHLMSICDLLIKSNYGLEWDCCSYERLENLNNEMLQVMYRAGCRIIHMGIESGSEVTRKLIKKSGSLDEIKESVRLVKENGIRVSAWFMLGFPDETFEEMGKTIKFAFSLKADEITFTPCFPLPRTQIYNDLRKKYNFKKINWSNFDIYKSDYPMSQLSSAQLTRLIKKLRLRLRLKSFVKRII